MNVRVMLEEAEKSVLSGLAFMSVDSKGRERPEEPCPLRTAFQRDRDRILYSKAFRRLKHKTQVFISPEGDHYRTRLTHTLEVSQIARTIARALRLNEDLTEAISMGHDLGHTPFGHAGERALNRVCSLKFHHNDQSIRVVEFLENDHSGLNLSWEVRDGIRCHTGNDNASTLEGKIVAVADRVAYINHDIEDAIRGGIITEADIPKDCTNILGCTPSQRINTMVKSLVTNSAGISEIKMHENVQAATDKLRDFMFTRVYVGSEAKKEEAKAERLVAILYETLAKRQDLLPADEQKYIDEYGIERVVCDYVAGMTDPFAVRLFGNLFLPDSWGR